jgi:nitrogen regulatory protein PII
MPINNLEDMCGLELVTVIVNKGAGSKVLHTARQHGLSGGTVLLGRGTVCNRLLNSLALDEIRKEIVLLLTKRTSDFCLAEIMNKELRLYKPNHGIAFSIPIAGVCGSKCFQNQDSIRNGGVDHTMYQAVYVIVDKGRGEAVVEAARDAGSQGATIINARGAGIHETSRLFAMDIEPEKELVLMILKESQTEQVIASLRAHLNIEKPGNGIIFVQNVSQTYGLYE